MMAFMEAHRSAFGVEPMCRVLQPPGPAGPVSCRDRIEGLLAFDRPVDLVRARAAAGGAPARLPARVLRDAEIVAHIRRVHEENFGVYGARPRRPADRRCCAVGSRGLLARDGLAAATA